MFNSIFNGDENSGIVIIKDSVEIQGLQLLKAYIKKSSSRGTCNVHLYCYVHEPFKVLSGLNKDVNVVNDYTKALLNYDQTCEFSEDFFPKYEKNCYVFIDDLSRLINLSSLHRVCKFLNYFKNNEENGKLVSVFHSNIHDDHVSSCIENYCESVVTLTPLSIDNNESHYAIASTIHKSKVGKIKKSHESLNILENFDLVIVPKLTTKETPDAVNTKDPLADLTFKVSLESNEITAKEKLDPPFLGMQLGFRYNKINSYFIETY